MKNIFLVSLCLLFSLTANAEITHRESMILNAALLIGKKCSAEIVMINGFIEFKKMGVSKQSLLDKYAKDKDEDMVKAINSAYEGKYTNKHDFLNDYYDDCSSTQRKILLSKIK